ncbi:deoxycytidylate deaminase [Clostridium tarantellae]|uniref:CMP deaminase n=1 Tax=Clostridium tarantellae TaxID=39493 RepID=A0A6I1MKH1_9CLOT|nr:cytidine/deoxycytidylate deaminase family protein [Clostridium tarantellae]MPQ43895.1 CMP deaminase [Clostridium tarantellae]
MSKRQSWDEYFMNLAEVLAERSTCDRAHVGCVIVNDEHRIVSTGYNGSVGSNMPHCDDIGHTMRDGHCIATVHAEINCLTYAAKEGISVKSCTAYVTHFPCLNCTKALVQSGIKKIIYKHDYRIDEYALEILKVNDVKLQNINM